jgi:hypothetical protein
MLKPVGRRDTTQEAIEILKERARAAAAARVMQ